MKNLHGLTLKFFIMSVLSATIMASAGSVYAEQANATFVSSMPVLLAANNVKTKPPFHRHAVTPQVVSDEKAADVSLKFLKWKPPLNRRLHRQDNLHTVQVAQLGDIPQGIIESDDGAEKKLKGSKPPYKRN